MIKNVASTIKRHTTCDRKHGSHHPIKWFWPVETSPPWVTLGTWSFCLILNKPEFGCFFAGRHTMESSFQDPLQWFFGSSSDEWISVPHFEFFFITTSSDYIRFIRQDDPKMDCCIPKKRNFWPTRKSPAFAPTYRIGALDLALAFPCSAHAAASCDADRFASPPGRPSGPWNWLSSTVMARNTSCKYNNNPIYGMYNLIANYK